MSADGGLVPDGDSAGLFAGLSDPGAGHAFRVWGMAPAGVTGALPKALGVWHRTRARGLVVLATASS